ncbi:MAG TPA: YqgE/AlgH family protein [Salinivirgaceae bacterium]|nr:YqgE/AlgH family protein [Salinivirgaceae bacterium]
MEDFDDIFIVNDDSAKVRKGSILISEPLGRDMFFKKSVILIVEHNRKGSVGFVINKPLFLPMREIFDKFPSIPDNISLGGPVELNSLHFIHTLGDMFGEAKRLKSNLYWGGDFEQMQMLMKAGLVDTTQIKFFVGYSGWEPGQLDDELSRSQWVVSKLSAEKIINSPRDLWNECIESLGQRFKPWLHVPDEPALN